MPLGITGRLRVLETGESIKGRFFKSTKTDVWVIAVSNKNLLNLIDKV